MQTADAVMSFGFKMLILSVVLALLPTSPFVGFVSLMNKVPFLQYVNWFIPIGEIIAVAELWLVAVLVYYGYMFILRFCNGLKGS